MSFSFETPTLTHPLSQAWTTKLQKLGKFNSASYVLYSFVESKFSMWVKILLGFFADSLYGCSLTLYSWVEFSGTSYKQFQWQREENGYLTTAAKIHWLWCNSSEVGMLACVALARTAFIALPRWLCFQKICTAHVWTKKQVKKTLKLDNASFEKKVKRIIN